MISNSANDKRDASSSPMATTTGPVDEGQERGETSPRTIDDVDGRDDVRHLLFADSTHRLLFTEKIEIDGTIVRASKRDVLLALVVVAFQLAAYLFLGYLVINEAQTLRSGLESRSLEIGRKHCESGEGEGYDNLAGADVAAEDLPGLLQCSDPSEIYGMASTEKQRNDLALAGGWIAIFLLVFFLLPDLWGSFVLFTCPGWRPKAASVVIFAESAVGIGVGLLGLSLADEMGYLNSFLLCVGILFVHDVDEQVAAAGGMLQAVFEERGRRPLEMQVAVFTSILSGTISAVYIFKVPSMVIEKITQS